MKMKLLPLLFSFKGRIPRSTWWYVGLAGWLAVLLVAVIAPRAMGVSNPVESPSLFFLVGFVFLVFWAVGMWVGCAVGAKRLHDRGRTGWWQAVPFVIGALAAVLAYVAILIAVGVSLKAPGAAKTLGAAHALGTAHALATATQILNWVSLGFGLWLFVEMGFLRGTQGPNRFGPDPLGALEADA